MHRLREVRPVWHAVFWIALYVGTVNVGDALSASVGTPNIVTAPLLLALSVGLLLYVRSYGGFAGLGLILPRRRDLGVAWYFLPLAVIALLPAALGRDAGLGVTGSALAVLLMLGVGFLEEAIFRGFLYRAILEGSGLTRAVVISGVTFGIGHVVNLLRGYTGGEQIVQVGAGVALGIVLALLVAVTGSILPGVLFHAMLNTGGTLTERALAGDVAVLAIMLAICAVYGLYLARALRERTPDAGLRRGRHRPELA